MALPLSLTAPKRIGTKHIIWKRWTYELVLEDGKKISRSYEKTSTGLCVEEKHEKTDGSIEHRKGEFEQISQKNPKKYAKHLILYYSKISSIVKLHPRSSASLALPKSKNPSFVFFPISEVKIADTE